jgi:glycosyltransferase involved in cell wall biosynthesis
MCEWKGHRFLIPALAQLRDRGVAFECDFAGDGETRAKVEGMLDEHRLRDRVRMLGNVPHGKLVASLEAGDYDLAVLASTEDGDEHEGIPVALMEAMAVSLPVVTTRTGSIPELVTAECGIVVEQRDVGALADAIGALLADPERRRRLGAAGRERVTAEFSTERTTAQLAARLRASAPWHEPAN